MSRDSGLRAHIRGTELSNFGVLSPGVSATGALEKAEGGPPVNVPDCAHCCVPGVMAGGTDLVWLPQLSPFPFGDGALRISFFVFGEVLTLAASPTSVGSDLHVEVSPLIQRPV